MSDDKVLRLTGAQMDDTIFTNEYGTWNVSKALRAAKAEKWPLVRVDVAPAYDANINATVDPDKVERFKDNVAALATPVLMAMVNGRAYLIDGHHRLRALHAIGSRYFLAYVIEDEDEVKYAILFNGKRNPPAGLDL